MNDPNEILPCRHCGHRPDRRRRICPQCGRPRWFLLLLPVLAVGAIWLGLHLFFGAGDSPPGAAERRAAARRMDRGEWLEAERLLRRAIDASDATVADRLNLATCLAETGRTEEALPLLRGILEELPGDVRARVRLAELLFERGDAAPALREAEAALGFDPANARAHLVAAEAAAATGDAEKAKDHLRRVRAARPEDPLIPYRLAALGGESAARHLAEAERLEPEGSSSSPVPPLLRARALVAAGDLDRADSLTAAALEARPDDPEVRLARGVVLSGLGRHDEAAEILGPIGGDAASGAASYFLGLALEGAGRREEAYEAFLRAAESGSPEWRLRAREHLVALKDR